MLLNTTQVKHVRGRLQLSVVVGVIAFVEAVIATIELLGHLVKITSSIFVVESGPTSPDRVLVIRCCESTKEVVRLQGTVPRLETINVEQVWISLPHCVSKEAVEVAEIGHVMVKRLVVSHVIVRLLVIPTVAMIRLGFYRTSEVEV